MSLLLDPDIDKVDLRICSRCIYDERVSAIHFDAEGICNYCRQVEELVSHYGTGQAKGEALFAELLADIKRTGEGKQYDCIVGVSGGTDSDRKSVV